MKEPMNNQDNTNNQETASSSTKKKELRFRNFEIVNQIDEEFDVKVFEQHLMALPAIKKYAFIIHDKDYKDEAKTKKHHTIIYNVPAIIHTKSVLLPIGLK